MKLKVTDEIKDSYGDVVKRPAVNDKGEQEMVPATLRFVFAEALLCDFQDETKDRESADKDIALSRQILRNDEVELSVHQAAKLKDRVFKRFGRPLYAPVEEILETAASAKA